MISCPIKNSRIKAMPIDPTSPAKHFALPFGRKLNKQNTTSANITVITSDSSTNPISLFNIYIGISEANE